MAKIFKHRTDVAFFDYKDFKTLQRFINQYGQIEPCKKTGLTESKQRQLARAIKRATRAELCIALSETSFLAPLRNDFYCFYSQCFRAVFPKKYGEVFKGWPSRPSFKGALKELKHKLQRKFQSKRGIGLDEKRSNESKKKGRKSHVTQSL